METVGRHELTDTQWQRLQALLPPQQGGRGRPYLEHRTIINGMRWIDKTGAPWRDMPAQYGSWKTVSSRFYRWRKAGVWEKVLAELQKAADASGQVRWAIHYLDSSVIHAHQHAAGAKGGSQQGKGLDIVKVGSVPRYMCGVRAEVSQ
jgi:transposase